MSLEGLYDFGAHFILVLRNDVAGLTIQNKITVLLLQQYVFVLCFLNFG